MRRLSLTQLLKNTTAFAAVSASAVDAGLLLAHRTGMLDVPGDWYVNGPLAVWFLAGIPASISLAERVLQQINPRPGRIISFSDHAPSPVVRGISLHANGQRSTLLAHLAPTIFGEKLPEETVYRPAIWYVPVDDNQVVVRESELRAFLEAAHRRDAYQFSRNYWTQKRRPPLFRHKYEAFMRLLTESGLIEGRHIQGGASGRLVTHPRYAVTYLKFESTYRITG